MCPAPLTSTNVLPHADAYRRACCSLTYSSSLLDTTTLAKGNGLSGIGEKPVGPTGYRGPSGSEGATSKAPRILDVCSRVAIDAQCDTSAHAELWATSTAFVSRLAIASSSVATQSTHAGVSQSC